MDNEEAILVIGATGLIKKIIALNTRLMFEQAKAYYKKIIPKLREDDWNAIHEKFTVQQLKKGDFLVRNGDVCRLVSFVNKGLLRMFYMIDGKDMSIAFVCENVYISEYASFLTCQPAAMNIEALEDCELVNLSFNDMQSIYKSIPVFETFGRKIAEALFIMISTQTHELLILTPEERYQSLTQHQPFIIQRVPQYMIASFIGITPEHLSRIRKKLAS